MINGDYKVITKLDMHFILLLYAQTCPMLLETLNYVGTNLLNTLGKIEVVYVMLKRTLKPVIRQTAIAINPTFYDVTYR